eukprot:PhM_4_TR8866/c0_g1_i1/m.15099
MITYKQLRQLGVACACFGAVGYTGVWFHDRYKSVPRQPELNVFNAEEVSRRPTSVLNDYEVVVRKVRETKTDDIYTTMHLRRQGPKARQIDSLTDQSVVKCSQWDEDAKLCTPDTSVLTQRYMRVMLSSLSLLPQPLNTGLNVLCMGMGAGVLPAFLQDTFSQHIKHMDIVEVEPEVVRAAMLHQGYFNRLEDRADVHVHIEDGDAFLSTRRDDRAPTAIGRYDAMFVDVFVGNDMPSHTATPSFFASCFRALNRHGVLVMNIHKNSLLKPIVQNCGVVFGQSHLYELPCGNDGNVVLMAVKAQPAGRYSKRHIAMRASKFSHEYDLPFDIGAHFPLYWLF